MGSTDSGKNWCLKALHPSDPLTEVTGLPDEDSTPTAFFNYQSTFTLTPPVSSGAVSWQFDSVVIPNPICMMWAAAAANTGANFSVNYLNPQVEGATHAAKYANWCTNFERWRLAYMAVTVYQDAPALANQGTIVVSQPPIRPKKCNPGVVNVPWSTTDAVHTPTTVIPHMVSFPERVKPEYERSQAMPNAYFARSEAGAYVPLKLTRTCQQWQSRDKSVINADDTPLEAVVPPEWQPFYELLGAIGIAGVPDMASVPPSGPFPYPSLQPVRRVNSLSSSGRTTVSVLTGQCTSPLCNDSWACISARNLSPSCSYSFFFRMGFEVQVNASSPMSPQLRISPPYDPVAIEHYFAIARELKDAYPADYNDLGKLWAVIKDTARVVTPMLKMIPGVGPLVGAIEPGVRAGIGALEKALMPSTQRNTPSGSTVERARKYIDAASTSGSTPPNTPRGKKGKRGYGRGRTPKTT